MPPIKVNISQKNAAVATGNDADTAFELGMIDTLNTQVFPPTTGYTNLTADQRQTAKNALAQNAAVQYRYVYPIAANYTNTSPNLTITSETQIASISLDTYVERQIVFHLNLSAYTNITSTKAGFRIKVNGTQVGVDLAYLFNATTDHRSMGGTWVGSIGPGAVTITAHLFRVSGTGSIILDSNDIITFSVVG